MRQRQVNMFTVRGRVGQRHNTALCEKQSVRLQTVATTEQSSRGTKQTGNLTKTHLVTVELRFYPTGRRTGIAPLWNPWEFFSFCDSVDLIRVYTRHPFRIRGPGCWCSHADAFGVGDDAVEPSHGRILK